MAGEGHSSMIFWCRRWIEHSRSKQCTSPPWPSASTWISTCLASVMYRSRNTVPSPNAAAASRRAAATASASSPGSVRIRIPLPPPPIAALTISGSGTPLRPGRPSPVTSQDSSTGTPTSASSRLAASLSPITSMTSAGGPTQASPAAVTARAKPAFSDRKP